MHNGRTKAFLALVGFAALSAFRDVWAKSLFKNDKIDPVTITWFACLVTFVLFYLTISFRTRRPYVFAEFSHADAAVRRQFILLNIGTLIAFVTTFLAIERLDAYRNAVIDYGFSPFVVAALAVITRGERLSPYMVAGMLMSMVGITILAAGVVASPAVDIKGAVFGGMRSEQWLGIGFAFTSTISMALVLIWTKNLVARGITKERILITRLPLAILVLPLVWAFKPFYLPDLPFAVLTLWSVLGISIPLLLIVYAFEQLQVKNVAVAFFLIPPLAFLGSLLLGHFDNQPQLLYAVAGVIVVGGVWLAERSDGFEKKDSKPAAVFPTARAGAEHSDDL